MTLTLPKRSEWHIRGREQKHRPQFHMYTWHAASCSLGWLGYFCTKRSNERLLMDWFSSSIPRVTMKAKESQLITFKEGRHHFFLTWYCSWGLRLTPASSLHVSSPPNMARHLGPCLLAAWGPPADRHRPATLPIIGCGLRNWSGSDGLMLNGRP